MSDPTDADAVRGLIAVHRYLALGTADASGRPWVSPVFFAPRDDVEFYWASSPEARHSLNIAVRPEVSLVLYDSRAAVGAAEALYISATATEVPPDDLTAAAALFNRRLPADKALAVAELRPPAPFRLYRATAVEYSLLLRGSDPRNHRGADDREVVTLAADR